MRLLADEGVEARVVERLRDEGHDVDYVAELSPGVSDDEVLGRADEDGRILITVDKDFGELVFRMGRVSTGVLLLRLAGSPPPRRRPSSRRPWARTATGCPGHSPSSPLGSCGFADRQQTSATKPARV